VCLITHIDLDHLIFSQRFTLFKMFLPFKIQLLSLRVSVEWLDVFVLLCLTDRRHVGKELFEDYPTLISESQLDEFEDYDGRDSSDSGSDWGVE